MNGTLLDPALLLFAASSAVLTGTVLLALRLSGRRIRHTARYLILAVCAIRILIPTGLLFPALIPIDLPREETVSSPVAPSSGNSVEQTVILSPSGQTGEPSRDADLPSGERPASDTGTETSVAPNPTTGTRITLPLLLVAVWGGGALICAALFLIPQTIASHRERRAALPADRELSALYDSICAEISGKRRPRLLVTGRPTVPHLTGFFRPAILIGNSDLSPDALATVLRHELIHYQRKDLWVRLILFADLCCFWWNPAVWFFVRRTQTEAELACDETALRGLDADCRCAYGQVILSVVRDAVRTPSGLSVGFSSRRETVQRFRELLDPSPRKSGTVLVALLCLLLCASCVIFGCSRGKPRAGSAPDAAGDVVMLSVPDLDGDRLRTLAQDLETPEREGYAFTGWAISSGRGADGSVSVSFEPRFSPLSYTVRFVTNGGTLPAAQEDSYTVESVLPTPSRVGNIFAGWFADVGLTRPVANVPAENCTLYAAWSGETPASDFTFTERDGGLTLTSYLGTGTDVTVPAYVGGMPVCAIGVNAFSFRTSLQTLTLPGTVSRIGAGAFRYCYRLERITLGAIPTEPVDRSAFEACYALREINFPGSAEEWLRVTDWQQDSVTILTGP